MTNEIGAADPLGDQHLFVAKVRDAAADARETYNAISDAYEKISSGASYWPSGRPAARLVRSIEAARRLDSTEGYVVLAATLADAAAEARRLNSLIERSKGLSAMAGVQLELFRGQYEARELVRTLDAAAARAGRLIAVHHGARRKRVQQESARAHRSAVAAFDLRASSARPQSIEVTLPGMLIGIAVLLLPAARRSRYSEEFRAEVRELPSTEQVGYAARQCLFALTLRRGLAPPFWMRRNGADDDVGRGGGRR